MYPVGTVFALEITPKAVVWSEEVSTLDQYEYVKPLTVAVFFVPVAVAAKAFILKQDNIKQIANSDVVNSLNPFIFFTILPLRFYVFN